jgi:hypothetical protein
MMVDLTILVYSSWIQSIAACIVYSKLSENHQKNAATLSSLGILANSEAFRKQLVWARDHPNSKGAKSLNAKLSCILSMVGSAIPYSAFEHAAT